MMQTLTLNQIISKINRNETFSAELSDHSLQIHINEYVPYVATAIHAGSQTEPSLEAYYALSQKERFYEEDPHTDVFILSLPITLISQDSRYSYDLNRNITQCIYEKAWGKQVWHQPLSTHYLKKLKLKHTHYYQLLKTLINKLEALFKQCYIFDIHSYNYQRITDQKTPTFNIGCHYIQKTKYLPFINQLQILLQQIELPNIDVQVEKDSVFQGKGYQAEFIYKNFKNTLLIPIEIKKIYMDERNGDPYPLVIEALTQGLQYTIKECIKEQNLFPFISTTPSGSLDPAVLKFDKKLYQLSKRIDVLHYVNPINYQSEKKRFFQKKCNYTPQFKYRQLKINPFEFRERLYKLSISDISSPNLRQLYREVIESIALDVDLLTSVGSDNFFYNSLRSFGEPNHRDIDNAKFLLHAPATLPDKESDIIMQPDEIIQAFQNSISNYNIPFTIKLSDQIIAKAMVDNSRKEVIINKHSTITKRDLNALIHHEVGVHALTTINAELQPLSLLTLGLPNNTHTQEGLAIYSEYLSGNLTIKRLHELALRVLAVEHMIKHQNFIKTYNYIFSNHNISENMCFRLIARVYRGGGFTKDFLYLSGLSDIIKNHTSPDFWMLLSGKTSLPYLNLLTNLKEEGWFVEPQYIPLSYQKSQQYPQNPIIDYLIRALTSSPESI